MEACEDMQQFGMLSSAEGVMGSNLHVVFPHLRGHEQAQPLAASRQRPEEQAAPASGLQCLPMQTLVMGEPLLGLTALPAVLATLTGQGARCHFSAPEC